MKLRRLKNIDLDQLKEDIENSELVRDPPDDLEELVQCYHATVSALIDKHAPVQEKRIKLHPRAPWYNEEIQRAKQERRRAERIWNKRKTEGNKEILKEKHKLFLELCDMAKEEYYSNKVDEHENNSKELFKICNSLLYKQRNTALPTSSCNSELANRIATFFSNKISGIRNKLPKISIAPTGQPKKIVCNNKLEAFNRISESEVSELILKGNSKSCCLDPIPTKIIKQILPALLPSITSIINKSLSMSHMPDSLKKAAVTPLLKKPTVNKEDLKNYRPVSNLPYIGKLIEKAAIEQMDSHISANELHEPLQSAYRKNHSTETALIKVTNDILRALDKRQCVFLVLLDLSAAFDTIDHHVFLSQLCMEYGMKGSVVSWMQSYLDDRRQCIHINNTPSDEVHLKYGFPQGSCIGPFGFKLYTKPLTKIAKQHKINIHLYADDTQLYTTFKPEESEEAMDRLEQCIEDIRKWIASHYLKLNDSKTEFMIFGSPHDTTKVTAWTVSIGDTEIFPSSSVRNIGAFLYPELNMRSHINNTIRACYAQLRPVAQIRRYLMTEAASKLCHAFITSRLDNMNSLLYKLPDYQIHRLQLVQNNTARLIKKLKRNSEDISDTLEELHWLPVEHRIKYKILLLMFKCHVQIAPSYLTNLTKPYIPGREGLRSSTQQLHDEGPKTQKNYGDRAFSMCGPKLWNKLPLELRQKCSVESFKKGLKTHLFKEAYNI